MIEGAPGSSKRDRRGRLTKSTGRGVCFTRAVRIRRALLLSDLHLGWAVCARQHAELLDRLPEAADDAELIVLNGDVIDAHRGVPGSLEEDLVARLAGLVATWRGEGRTVVYVEGNHDARLDPNAT